MKHKYIRKCVDKISPIKIKYLLTYRILDFVHFNILLIFTFYPVTNLGFFLSWPKFGT